MPESVDIKKWQLPEETLFALSEILGGQELVEKLRGACLLVLSLDSPESLRVARRKIESFISALQQLSASIDGLPHTATGYLHYDPETDEPFEQMGTGRLKYLGIYRDGLGKELSNLWNEVVHLEKHASAVLAKLPEPKSGNPPKQRERLFALCVAQVLVNADVPISKYADGIFFKVLEQLFPVVFPDCGPESHRRHGVWVLNTFPDSEDISTFRLRGIE